MDNLVKIKELTDELGEIFAPINKKYCSNCVSLEWKEKDKWGNKGCCSNCMYAEGYFGGELSKIEKESLKEFYRFDSKHGFFDDINKTCKLPREKRSSTCLRYVCEELLNKVNRVQIDDIIEQIEQLR